MEKLEVRPKNFKYFEKSLELRAPHSHNTDQNTLPTNNYNIIAIVHSRLTSLVSSETIYSLPYSPKTRYK